MGAHDGKVESDGAGMKTEATDTTPSGVVRRADQAPRSTREPGSVRSLTPYQARLDVEMDDTAVSKVRDPSVSFRLSRKPGTGVGGHARQWGPLASVVLGVLGGVLVVLVVVAAFRACGV